MKIEAIRALPFIPFFLVVTLMLWLRPFGCSEIAVGHLEGCMATWHGFANLFSVVGVIIVYVESMKIWMKKWSHNDAYTNKKEVE